MPALEIRAIFVFLNDLMALSQTTSIDTGHSLVEVAGTSPATTPSDTKRFSTRPSRCSSAAAI
jgi:hypothetical protein